MRTKTPFLAEKMLEAAGRLFGTRRFHEVRMEDIAVEAAVSKGTLYRYFKNKEEMHLALLERASHQIVEQLQTRVAAAEGSRARLVAFVDALVTFFDERPHLFSLVQRAEVAREQGKAFPWQAVRDQGMRIVLDIFEQARRSREFTVRNPQSAMLMLLGGLRAIIQFGERPRRLADHLVDDFLQGATTTTPSARRSAKRPRNRIAS